MLRINSAQRFHLLDDPVASCPGHANVVIVAPREDQELYIEPGGYPAGPTPDGTPLDILPPIPPTVELLARVYVRGAETIAGVILWNLWIHGDYQVRKGKKHRDQAYHLFLGSTIGTPGVSFFYQLPMVVGGRLEVTAEYISVGQRTAPVSVTCQVLGRNPRRSDVEELVKSLSGEDAWALLRIFSHESLHQMWQFNDGARRKPKGYPLYGAPSGVGVGQRDPEAKEWVWPALKEGATNNFFPRIFWDWQENIREGVTAFLEFYLAKEATRFLKEIQVESGGTLPDPPRALLLRAAIRRYNGGKEYALGTDKHGHFYYKVEPDTLEGHEEYVNQVLDEEHYEGDTTVPVPEDASKLRWPDAPPQQWPEILPLPRP
jgi:type VI secretion system secreted protein VgrG